MTVLITLTLAGSDVGPFDLYSNVDGYVTPFETGVSRADLLAGYTSILVPADSATILAKSTGVCNRDLYMTIEGSPSTTTTTTTSTTSTTTTTYVPVSYDYYLAERWMCNTPSPCTLDSIDVTVAFPAGTSYIGSHFYVPVSIDGYVYKITGTTSASISVILDPTNSNTNCSIACAVV